jgi:hypothetical protein
VEISVSCTFLFQIGEYEPFPLKFTLVPEVDEVAYFLMGDPHVVEQLCFVLRDQFGNCLKFNDNAAEHE